MKKSYTITLRTILIVSIALIGIIIILYLGAATSIRKVHNIDLKNAYIAGKLSVKRDTLIASTDKNGDPIYITIDKNSFDLDKKVLRQNDSLLSVIEINNKDLLRMIGITSVTDNSKATGTYVKDKDYSKDSLWKHVYSKIPRTYTYKDTYYEYTAVASDSLRFVTNKMYDSLYLIYSKVPGKDKNLVTATIKNNNKNVKYSGINSINYEEQKRIPSRFGISVFGGVGYTPGNKKPSPMIGVGLTYDIIQFKKKVK